MHRLSNEAIDKNSQTAAYLQVRDRLLHLIREGQFAIGEQLPPEPQLAKAFGVSRVTLGRALAELCETGHVLRQKGRGTFVAPESNVKQPDPLIMVLLAVDVQPAYDDAYFSPLFWSIDRFCHVTGFATQTARWEADSNPSRLPSNAVGAIAISPERSVLDSLAALKIPVVLLGADWPGSGFTGIDSDNMMGIAIALNHLVALGHQRIGFVGGYPESSNTQDRFRGFSVAMAAQGLTFRADRDVVMAKSAFLQEADIQAAAAMLSRADRPTALLAAGSHVAAKLMQVLPSLGISVPEDLSIVGYDDTAVMAYLDPPVTTIRQPLREMAEAAVSALQDQIVQPVSNAATVRLSPELVIRQSTAVPKRAQPAQTATPM